MKYHQLTVIQHAVLKRIGALGLPSGARVLDAPCGGNAALTCALKEQGFNAVGADIDSEAATLLGERFAKVDLNRPFPWPDQTFEAKLAACRTDARHR